MAEVSIIVPIYNVENYLEKCLKSIIEQTFQDIEIICVDDGSTDNSSKILNEFAQKDSRIKIIKETNQGVFAARHNGLKNATSKYILFIDSDDWIDKNLIKKTLDCIKKYNTDVVVYGAYSVRNSKLSKGMYSVNKIPKKYKEKVLTIKDYEDNLFYIPPTAWNKLYKKEFLDTHNIKFQEIRNGEDQIFYLHTILTARNIYIIDENLYYYTKNRTGSITYSYRKTTDSPISNFYIAEHLLNALSVKEKFINQIINKYFSKTLSWFGKCDKNFRDDFYENLYKLKDYLDTKYPNGWWKYFKLNKKDGYLFIKAKIIFSKVIWILMDRQYA